ncbi:MAG: urea carboxylase-associated family protein [Candidatus Eremiobacteraeota bacterium]|nr:urea carboxylase-associated family protein [Candidatus Eremiobacteraeota bacterium]
MDLSIPSTLTEIASQTGAAFRLRTGDVLHIVSLEAEQVADMAIFDGADPRDSFSGGRTIDYNERITLEFGDVLYSHRSTPLAQIVDDTVGVHDILLTPCSQTMFARRGENNHRSCHENLFTNLAVFGIVSDDVVATVNVFMDVRLDRRGRLMLHPPKSRPGDRFSIRALRELIVGLTACSSELTNNGVCKRVAYGIDKQPLPSVIRTPHG